jgi:hypothetical protein
VHRHRTDFLHGSGSYYDHVPETLKTGAQHMSGTCTGEDLGQKKREKKTRPIATEYLPGSDYTCGSQALNVERAGRSRVGPGALPGSATVSGRAMTNSVGAKSNCAPLPPALLTPFLQWLFSALGSLRYCWMVLHEIHSGVTRVDAADHMASGMLGLLGSCTVVQL